MKTPATLVVVLLVLMLNVQGVGGARYEIRPGGSYTVEVTLEKPSYLRLPEGDWEVRVYFFDGRNNYCTGSWSQLGGSWMYSGWWIHRASGIDWTDTSETKELSISVDVVSYPRPEEDKLQGMGDIPINASVDFRIRLIIKNIKAIFPGEEGEEIPESGYVTFYVGGSAFRYPFTTDPVYERYFIFGEGLWAEIDRDYRGRWRLKIDKSLSAYVSEAAPETDTLVITEPLEINLQSVAQPEPTYEIPGELGLAGGTLVILTSLGIAIYLGFRRREEEEFIPEH
jgi:hypothetical protein